MATDLFLPVFRHHAAVLFVIIAGGEIEVILPQLEAEFRGRGFKHAHAFRHHFLADTVTGNDGDAIDAIGGVFVAGDGTHGRFLHPGGCSPTRWPRTRRSQFTPTGSASTNCGSASISPRPPSPFLRR